MVKISGLPLFDICHSEDFMDFDLIVIGGGTAGLSAMKTAHALGAKLAIVEEEDFAGTCLRTG